MRRHMRPAAAPHHRSGGLESLDDTVAVERGQGDVHDPQHDKDEGAQGLPLFGATQLGLDGGGSSTQHQHGDSEDGENGEAGDGEGQVADLHSELLFIGRFSDDGPVDGGHGPGDTDTEEDVDGVGAGYVTDGSIGVWITAGGNFTGEGVCEEKNLLINA